MGGIESLKGFIQRQLDILDEIEKDRAAKHKQNPVIADYLVRFTTENGAEYYLKQPHPVGHQPDGSVLVPDSEWEWEC